MRQCQHMVEGSRDMLLHASGEQVQDSSVVPVLELSDVIRSHEETSASQVSVITRDVQTFLHSFLSPLGPEVPQCGKMCSSEIFCFLFRVQTLKSPVFPGTNLNNSSFQHLERFSLQKSKGSMQKLSPMGLQ